MGYNLEDIRLLMEERRTIYPEQYSSKKVDREVVMQLLDATRWVPTHRFTQPWRFRIFMGKGLETLSEFQSGLYKKVSGADVFSHDKYASLRSRPLKASAVIGIGLCRDEQERDPVAEEIASVAMAVQNINLLAAAQRIGTFWYTGGVTYRPETALFIGLEKKDLFMGFLYLGCPAKEWPPRTRRRPVEHYTDWIEN